MTALRQKMMQDLELAGYADKTRRTYIECIRMFAKFHRRSDARGALAGFVLTLIEALLTLLGLRALYRALQRLAPARRRAASIP